MVKNSGPNAAPDGGTHPADILVPLVALAESRAATLAHGSRELVDRAVDHAQAVMADLDGCLEAVRQERDPLSIARCYGHFLLDLSAHNASEYAELSGLLFRTGTAMLLPQVDGSRTEARLERERPSSKDGAASHATAR